VLNQWKSIKECNIDEDKAKKEDLLKSLLEQTEGVLLFLTHHYQKEIAPHAEALLSTLISLLEIRVSLKSKIRIHRDGYFTYVIFRTGSKDSHKLCYQASSLTCEEDRRRFDRKESNFISPFARFLW